MGVHGIGGGYPAWYETGKTQTKNTGINFADRIVSAGMAGSASARRNNVDMQGQTSILEAYRASAASAAHNMKPAYDTYESENYKIVPDNENGCFDIYNGQGEKLGVFRYSDIKVRQDGATGKQFLISEYGTGSCYDAIVLDHELKGALQGVVGVETLETVDLHGYTLKTHSGTGIQYLVRAGEEGRGGKVLLQDQSDIQKYEALAETYFSRYPNLIESKEEAYIWADLEIKGLAQHTDHGIVSMGYDGMSYNDNADEKNSWSILFSGDTYKLLFEWLQNHRESMEEMEKFVGGLEGGH